MKTFIKELLEEEQQQQEQQQEEQQEEEEEKHLNDMRNNTTLELVKILLNKTTK